MSLTRRNLFEALFVAPIAVALAKVAGKPATFASYEALKWDVVFEPPKPERQQYRCYYVGLFSGDKPRP